MADKIDIRPTFPPSRSVPSTNIADRRKKPEDKPKQNKKSPPHHRRPDQDEGQHIDEYV